MIDDRWRERAEAAQESALLRGATVLSCPAPLDSGGLGHHLRELLGALERAGQPRVSISTAPPAGVRTGGDLELSPGALARAAAPLARLSRGWRVWAHNADFDREASRRLPRAEHLIAFNGAALAQLQAGNGAGLQSLSLVSANSHFQQVVRQHARAHERDPIEGSWVRRLLARNLAEYRRAHRIYYASEYIRESFVRAGHPESTLERFPLTPNPRFRPPAERAPSETFDIVFVGSLTVHKGVPLLIDALARLPQPDIRLILIGGWGTRGMRRYLEAARERDRRISFAPGDPLAHLQRARLCVHPAWEDGFGYAPAEALACGVPVIVSEDTGMKELIDAGRTGVITPTGDLSELVGAVDAAYRGELFGVR